MFARILFGILISFGLISPIPAQEWQRLGPPGGMVLSLATGMGGAVYLGTADGHVFVRESPNVPWQLRGRIGIRTDAVVSSLVADQREAGVVYAAVWYQQPGAGGGVFQSKDGARTWKLLGLQLEAVRALEFAPSQPKIMLAGARSGVFRSADAGMTWERITPVDDPELRNVDSLAIDPRDANTIYTGTYHLPWKTTDGGKTWQPVIAGLIDDSDIMSLRIDVSRPERLFLSACSGIYRSEDQGGQWNKLQGIPYAARRTQSIVQDPVNPQTLYAGTTEGLWVTRDGGESWERTTPKDWVINSLTVLPGSSKDKDRVLLGTESRGVQWSEDFGKTFVEWNEGFTHDVVRQLIGDFFDSRHLLMLAERNGAVLWESQNAGQSWEPVTLTHEDGQGKSPFTPEAIETLYASPWGWMARLANGQLWILERQSAKWKEWKLQLAELPAVRSRNSAPSAYAKAVPVPAKESLVGGMLIFSALDGYVPTQEGLLRCAAIGKCVRLKAFGRRAAFGPMSVSSDGATLRVVASGRLATSADGGQSALWNDLPLPAEGILWLDSTENAGATDLFLGTISGLYASLDGGVTWTRRQLGLPEGQMERFVRGHRFSAVTLREGGMYVSQDNGTSWNRMDRDPERGRFTGVLETSPGVLTIGSQSEGVLRWILR